MHRILIKALSNTQAKSHRNAGQEENELLFDMIFCEIRAEKMPMIIPDITSEGK